MYQRQLQGICQRAVGVAEIKRLLLGSLGGVGVNKVIEAVTGFDDVRGCGAVFSQVQNDGGVPDLGSELPQEDVAPDGPHDEGEDHTEEGADAFVFEDEANHHVPGKQERSYCCHGPQGHEAEEHVEQWVLEERLAVFLAVELRVQSALEVHLGEPGREHP